MKSRRILIIFLILLTVGLGAVAVYVAYILQKQTTQAPPSSQAAGAGYTNICGCSNANCGSSCGYCNVSGKSCSGTWVVRYTCDGSVTQCTQNEQEGVGSIDTSQCGKTQQIDVFSKDCRLNNGGWDCNNSSDLLDFIVYYTGDCTGGTTPTPTTKQKKACGESCSDSSDCLDYSTAGENVDCIGGKCANVICPNDTEYGTICNCTGTVRCGEACGYGTQGLCGDEISSCRYLSQSCPAGINDSTHEITVCYPVARETVGNEYYDATFDATWDSNNAATKCTTRDTGNAWIKKKNPTTGATVQTNFTRAEIAALCKWCGNNIIETGEQCDEGSKNGTSSSECSKTCQLITPTTPPVTTPPVTTPPHTTVPPTTVPPGTTVPPTTPPVTSPAPRCADPCTTNANCPNDHMCSTTTHRCVLIYCYNNPDRCYSDLCTLLTPKTALFDDQSDKLIIGIILVVTGITTYYLGVYSKIGSLIMNTIGTKIVIKGTTEARKESFEKKMKKKKD